ncbi:MAG: hypothetical protein WBG08_04565 [Litorimonas sp.]
MTLGAVLLAACSTTGAFYPIAGPLAAAGRTAPVAVELSGLEGRDGNLSLTLPDGETFEGVWTVIPFEDGIAQWGPLMSQYGMVPGSGLSLGAKSGRNRGQAYLVGTRGNTMDVEFTSETLPPDGVGIARDSRGNVYRIVF